ncbi:Uncharacterised protein [Mycobacteroides abscessus subsp. massiliense]|nr:Uncharacterised protein [Mycobacteroides abscessus subsp. massiliense]
MSEQGRCCTISAKSGAVYIDKCAFYQMARFFQFKNPACQHGFASACGAGKQNGGGRVECNLFDFGNHAVEGGVLGGNTAFQVAHCVIAYGGKAFCQYVVTSQV